VRDLISWALAEGELQTYRPGETVSLSIPITNTSSITTTAVELALVSPARQFAFTQTLTTTIGPGQAIIVPFTTTATLPLGIWNVEATLFNGPNPISNLQSPTSAFVVHNPPPATAPNRALLFNITAPNDHFVPGSVAPFTLHVFNQSDVERTATIRYGLPHHTWESGDAATYGNFHDLSQTLTVPANGEATYTWQVPVFTTDRLWAKLFEGNLEVGQAHLVRRRSPTAPLIRPQVSNSPC
jgi:hypothetical protein